MGLKILYSLVTILIFSTFIYGQSTPEERCSTAYGGVCMDCFRRGTCVDNGDGSYTVAYSYNCPSGSYCDDTLNGAGNFGMCTPISASSTLCGCSTATQCIEDPNNPAAILHCEYSSPVTDNPCSPPAVDLTTCSCSSCSDSCPFLDDPNDNCASYFVCSGDELIPVTCAGTSCFDQESCGCVETTSTTSTIVSTTSIIMSTTSTSEPLTCPSGCPFVDDPNDSCSNYFVCSGDELIPVTCTGTLCFEQASCGCVTTTATTATTTTTAVTTTTTTATTTTTTSSSTSTPLTCPSGCPFVDDPNDNCGKYFVCSGGELLPVTCTGTLCFDQASCGCVDITPEPTTTSTTLVSSSTAPVSESTSLTCPSGCPFVDDPNDSCGKFYICDEGSLIATECPGTLCFDQGTCSCQ